MGILTRRVRPGSQGHSPLAQSTALLHLCHESERTFSLAPCPAPAVYTASGGALEFGEGVRRTAERGFPWREEQRGLGRFLNSLSHPQHTYKHRVARILFPNVPSLGSSVSQETPHGDAPSCQPPWQPLGGCGSLFCLETPERGSHAVC